MLEENVVETLVKYDKLCKWTYMCFLRVHLYVTCILSEV